MKILFKLIFIILLIYPGKLLANDLKFYLSISSIYTNINDPNYKFINNKEIIKDPLNSIKSLNAGLSKQFDNGLNLSIQTNRFVNFPITRSVINNQGVILQNKSKLTSDTLLIGYKIKRFIPSLLISNSKLDKSLYYQNKFQGNQVNHSIITGININYFLTKNIQSSFIYIAPNKEFNLESGLGLGLTYVF